ncbi:MAG: hypothetical protein ACE5FH_03130 [Candidatus Zixiibacteriota bacterium]
MKNLALLASVALTCLCVGVFPGGNVEAARIEIEPASGGPTGFPSTVNLFIDSLDFEISGFDLLLSLRQDHYISYRMLPGQFFTDCDWEYFSYRLLPHDSIGQLFPGDYTDLLQLHAIAGVSVGAQPTCFTSGNKVSIAKLDLLIAHNSDYAPIDCSYLPLRFFWRDCNDNRLISRSGDTVHTASELFEYPSPDPVTYPFPGYGIPQPASA